MELDWKDKRWAGKKGSQLFEELCFEIIKLDGYKNVKHLKGSADSGRDIEAEKTEIEPDRKERTDRYWFQCKLYNRGIGLKDISDSILNAQNHNINFLVLMTNSHITPSLKDHITKANKNKKNGFRINYLEGKIIEERIIQYHNRFSNPSHYFKVDSNGKETKQNLLNDVKFILNHKNNSPFSSKEENEFDYFYQQFNYNVVLDVSIEASHSMHLIHITEMFMQYTAPMLDIMVDWLCKDPFNERTISVKHNFGVSVANIFNVEFNELLDDLLFKNDFTIHDIIIKELPILDLVSTGLLKKVDYFSFILGKKMQRFYYWLKYKGYVKEKISFKKISEKKYKHSNK